MKLVAAGSVDGMVWDDIVCIRLKFAEFLVELKMKYVTVTEYLCVLSAATCLHWLGHCNEIS